jgi:integrase
VKKSKPKEAKKPNGSGHIRARTLSDGSLRYDVLIKPDGVKQETLKGGLKDRTEADAYLAAWYVQRSNAGLNVPVDTGIVTVRKLGQMYLASIEKQIRKFRTQRKRWNARLVFAEFIDWPLTQLSEVAVRRWIDTMAQTVITVGKSAGKTPERGTLSTALSVLRAALKYGVIKGLIDRNAAKDVTISESTMSAPQGTSAGDGFDYLYEREVKAVLESKVLPGRPRTAYVLLAFTGARPMDLYLLDWEQVDVTAATVRYWSHKRKRHYTAHLLPQALKVLRAWWIKAGQPKTGLVFPGPDGKPHTDGYDWGWQDTRGRRMSVWYNDNTGARELSARPGPKTDAGALDKKAAVRLRRLHGDRQERKGEEVEVRQGWRSKIGIERNLPLYSLRHTCASHLLLGTKMFTGGRRWSMPEVASHLGHADLSTVRRYCVALGIMSLVAVEESRALLEIERTSDKQGSNPP